MNNPYKIELPFVVSFSGGRTSGYMLRKILDAYGGTLPKGGVVAFGNTGREHAATYDFINAIEKNWACPIVWLEYRASAEKFAVVNYETANRDGKHFGDLITKRKFLPNPIARFCTSELKVIPIRRYMESIGYSEFATAIGLRHDEPRRVAKVKADLERDIQAPLFDAGADEETVLEYWRKNHFDLQLPNNDKAFGNCDLCFLKSQSRIERVIEESPDTAQWWIDQENKGGTFRNDRPRYRDMFTQVTTQGKLFQDLKDDTRPCDCTD